MEATYKGKPVKWKDLYRMDDNGALTDSLFRIHAFVATPASDDEPEGNHMICKPNISIWDEDCRPKPFSELIEGHREGNVRCKACERLVYGRPAPKSLEPGTVKFSGFRTPYKIAEVIFLKGKGNYTSIYMLGEKFPKLTTTTLKVTAENCGFLRINRGLAVNEMHIEQMRLTKKDAYVILTGDVKLPISRRVYKQMRKANSNQN